MSSQDAVTKRIQEIRELFEPNYGPLLTDEEERYLEVTEKVLRQQFPKTPPVAAD
jgi:hypothetical protein